MTTETEALSHFGVKGMRWGVRKTEDSAGGSSGPSKKVVKAEKKWEKEAGKSFFKDWNSAAKYMNKTGIQKINNKPEYKNKNMKFGTPLERKYHNEMGREFTRAMTASAKARLGSSPLKGRELKYNLAKNGEDIEFRLTDAKHDAFEDFYFLAKRNSMGHIISVEVIGEEALTQADTVEEFLEHYGVKGMKWGVRNADRPAASGDAENFRGVKTKARAGGVKSLTNKELQDFITRANLEQQYHRLNPSAKKKALQFTADILLGVGKQQAMKLAGDAATKLVSELLKK